MSYIIRKADTPSLKVILTTAADSQYWAFHHTQLTPNSWFLFAHLEAYLPVSTYRGTTVMLGVINTGVIPKLLKDLTIPGAQRKKMIEEENFNMFKARQWFPFVDTVEPMHDWDKRTHRIEIDYTVSKIPNTQHLIYGVPVVTLHWESGDTMRRASFGPEMSTRWAECLNQLMLEAMLERP